VLDAAALRHAVVKQTREQRPRGFGRHALEPAP
jgi:hypothetical protein